MQKLNSAFAQHKIVYSLVIVLVVVALTSIGVYAYLVNNRNSDNNTNKADVTATPIATQEITPTTVEPQAINCEKGKNLFTLMPSGKPILVEDQPQLVEFVDKVTAEQNFDKLSKHYEMGEFKGEINGKKYDTKYYAGVYTIKPIAIEFPTSEMTYIVRYIIDQGKTIVFDNGALLEVSDQAARDYEDMGVEYIKYQLAKNVIDVSNNMDCIINSLTNPDNFEIKTDDGVELFISPYNYEFYSNDQLKQFKKVDSYKAMDIYMNSDDKMYLAGPEGFSIPINYNLNKLMGLKITVKKGEFAYEPFLGACTAYSTIFLDLDAKDMVEKGSVKGNSNFKLFALKEIDNEYTKKIYNEDYAVAGQKEGMWQYNQITEDDAKPLSYEKFLEYDPVLFTPLPYGKYLMFYNLDFMMVGGCAKPAIYIYSDVDQRDLEIKVIPNGTLTGTIPSYDDGWKVQVNKDGNIFNYQDSKTYSYLWWDSYANQFDLPKGGYVIAKSEIDQFLAQKLIEMNLSQQEQQDFLEYWTAEFAQTDSEYFYISFLFNDQVDRIAKLEFSQQPENIFRMFMVYRPVTEFVNIPAPKLEKANRDGFTVVEWGGGKI